MARSRTHPCVICGRTGSPHTKEHVLPQWLRQVTPLGMVKGIPSSLTFQGKFVRNMYGFDVVLREVCEDCNGGWLHDLERAFRESFSAALLGDGVPNSIREVVERRAVPPTLILDRGAQLVISTWAVKTWLLLERAWKAHRGSTTETNMLPFIRRENHPPPGMQVFVGALALPQHNVNFNSVSVTQDGHLSAVLACLSIRHAIFVFHLPVGLSGRIEGPRVRITKGYAGAFAQVWPNEVVEVGWPPPRVLLDPMLLSLLPTHPVGWSAIPWFERVS